jgi:hypothetical protein
MTSLLCVRRILSAVALALLPACAPDPAAPSPSAGFDAARTLTATQVMQDAFRGGPWLSFRALGTAMDARVAATASAAPGSALSAGVPRLPFELRGRTLVYDPLLEHYVVDESRTGAPANGVRFVVYEVDSLTGRPVVSREIGFAEITDEGDALASGVALHLQVITGGVRRLDYFVRADGSDTTGMLVAAGTVGDGLGALRFEVGLAAVRSAADSLTMRFAFELPAHGFAATGALRNVSDGVGTVGEAAVAVSAGADLIELNARGDSTAMEATFRVNGHLFARVAGEPSNPVIHGEGGRPLTEGERQALGAIMGLVGDVFGVVQALLQPAGGLLGVGR